MKLITNYKQILSDLSTPVGLYLKLREKYPEVLLLESSDYSSKEDSQSFICFDSLQTIEVVSDQIKIQNHHTKKYSSKPTTDVVKEIEIFKNQFKIDDSAVSKYGGVFGFTSFDAIQYFDTIKLSEKEKHITPDIRYDMFRYIIVFEHFNENMYVIEYRPDGTESGLDHLMTTITRQDQQSYNFSLVGEEEANYSDDRFKEIVNECRQHCQQGNLFQIVPSRRYQQAYKGDEFNLYRALRSINPSPYLFYFDYGSYKIFGSSPEAQLIIKDSEAEIHPIAGTFKRTGDFDGDNKAAQELLKDPKENAEHTMLVDLARNDLSKNCNNVYVDKYKEVQFFSHVIHLVSVVKGNLKPEVSAYQIFADTFPAGTLSGAPKYRALQIIDTLEPTRRGFYGGGIGMLGLDGSLNHAIMIRSFLSLEGKLNYQAGAGIVIDSDPESELNEVKNKLAALKKAIISAEKI